MVFNSMKKCSDLALVPLTLAVLGLTSVYSLSGTVIIDQALAQEEDNQALVMTFFNDVYDNRNVSAIDRHLAVNSSSGHPILGNVIGKEAITENISAVHDSFPDLTRSLESMVAQGDMVATFHIWNGTFSGEEFEGIPPNGNPFVAGVADLFRISDGQIVEHWQIGDYSNFTQAIGIEN